MTVALIAALGMVAVALIGLAANWISNRGRTSESPPAPDHRLGERVAVAEDRVADSHRTLDMLDRHVDGIDTRVDRLQWEMDDLKARVDLHIHRHDGGQQ